MTRHDHQVPPAHDAHEPSRLVRLRSFVAHHPLLLGGPLIGVAIAAGWFGPTVSATARGRIGEVVAAARGRWTLVRSRIEPRETALVGHHGSLTPAELLVPLLVARG